MVDKRLLNPCKSRPRKIIGYTKAFILRTCQRGSQDRKNIEETYYLARRPLSMLAIDDNITILEQRPFHHKTLEVRGIL